MVKVLRSLARHIHPQLPLSHKESDKLLTALTGAFRQHLDAAHPPNVADIHERKHGSDRNVTTGSKHRDTHSSAASADRHLASILTSPLFTREPVERPRSPEKATLSDNDARHPVDLLDEHISAGSLTYDLAYTLLAECRHRWHLLPWQERMDVARKLMPGQKTFEWLTHGRLYDPQGYFYHPRFTRQLCYSLVLEGKERMVWDWLKLDISLPRTQSTTTLDAYRWRGPLLERLVAAQLYTLRSFDSVVDTMRTAQSLKSAAPLGSPMRSLPLQLAHGYFCEWITIRERPKFYDDWRNADDYIHLVKSMDEYPKRLSLQLDAAWLSLIHPQRPSAAHAYELLQEHFALSATERATRPYRRASLIEPADMRDKWPLFLSDTIKVLEQTDEARKAEWVRWKASSVLGLTSLAGNKSMAFGQAKSDAANKANLDVGLENTSFA